MYRKIRKNCFKADQISNYTCACTLYISVCSRERCNKHRSISHDLFDDISLKNAKQM